jgi:hypothetical protein
MKTITEVASEPPPESAQMPQQTKANSAAAVVHSLPRRSSFQFQLMPRAGACAPGQPTPVGSCSANWRW